MWALFALSSIELAVVHLLVTVLAGWQAALMLSALSLAGMGWIVMLIRSFRRLPVRIGHDRVVLRAGRLRTVEVPLAHIAGIQRHWDSALLKQPGTVNLALIAYPNVLIALDPPVVTRRRPIHAVAHKLDAPDAFLEALGAARAGAMR
jgi:hypothetical protein